MTTIIYLEENGESQVLTEITNIALMGIDGDNDAQHLARYIRQGLKQLEDIGVPANKRLMMTGYEDNGNPRTFHLLKPLTCNRPLMEFRVNRSRPGAFRGIFFEYQYEGEQLIVFTRAVLKDGDINPPEFQQAIRESEYLYDDFHNDPEKYLGEGE